MRFILFLIGLVTEIILFHADQLNFSGFFKGVHRKGNEVCLTLLRFCVGLSCSLKWSAIFFGRSCLRSALFVGLLQSWILPHVFLQYTPKRQSHVWTGENMAF